MGYKTIKWLLLPLVLIACHEGVTLTVSQLNDGAVKLDVASFSSDFHPCIDNASISPVDRQDNPVWTLGRSDPHACMESATIGVAKPGYTQDYLAPLRLGETYCVQVNGPGFNARRGFSIDRTGVTQNGKSVALC